MSGISLHKDSAPRRTRIVCTIGPSSSSESVIGSLLHAGMDVARINFAHGTYQEHADRIATLEKKARQLGLPLAIMQDLPGPKDRTGIVEKKGVVLKDGSDFTLTTRPVLGNEQEVSIDWLDLPQSVKLGDTVFLDDGALKLEVTSITQEDVHCKVLRGGKLEDHRGINIPGLVRSVDSMTDQDWNNLNFGIEHNVDFIALSFIGQAEDVLKVRRFLTEKNADKMIIAKIERRQALENIDEILEVADGIMVARGDMGIEIPIQKVPVVQKQIIKKCNKIGKPVIVATQMLESMVQSPRPTRAEVTDVANAIFDGADAVMLSEETAIGFYPVETISIMSQVALETEASLSYDEILADRGADIKPLTDDAISFSACHIARQLGAAAIVAFTSSGSTARRVAKYRPGVPILAITPNESTVNQLSLSWGVRACKVPSVSRIMNLFAQGTRMAKKLGLARDGDLVVITGGVPIGVAGTTNLVKVQKI
jgi:pyruvate kinase